MMTNDRPLKEICHGDWTLGTSMTMSQEQMPLITDLVSRDRTVLATPLEGRSQIIKTRIKGIGQVVIKPYLRGGMMQYLLNDKYIKSRYSRARQEFVMLEKAAGAGVQVPKPIFYLQRGKLFYACWLATMEVPNQGSIAAISRQNPNLIPMMMPKICQQITRLIQAGIHHVDLHPGNLLAVENKNEKYTIYVVDFDKAKTCTTSPEGLDRLYVKRWNRAVKKHALPDSLLTTSFF